MSDVLLRARRGSVLTLTINRPEALNALNRETNSALRNAIEAAARDAEVGAIVLTGSGRAFCAGADLKDVVARHAAGDTELGEDLRRFFAPVIRAARACPKPIVAAINGIAAGAGLSLALACDFRIATSDAQLIVAFVRVGLVPDAGSLFFLTRMLGLSKATELAMGGDPITAGEAQRLGLVARVVRSDELLPAAIEQAQRFADGPRRTYELIKRGLERTYELDLEHSLELEAQLQGIAARSQDAWEGIQAFVEKRKPKFGD